MTRFNALIAQFFWLPHRNPPTAPAPSPPSPLGVSLNDPLYWINTERVKAGLVPMRDDATMTRFSIENNVQQHLRNLEGHFVTPGPGMDWGQCAAMGSATQRECVAQWMELLRHRAIILTPRYRFGGFAVDTTIDPPEATFTCRV